MEVSCRNRKVIYARRFVAIGFLFLGFSIFKFTPIGTAFFSDFVRDGQISASSGCIQITPILSIDGQTGDEVDGSATPEPCTQIRSDQPIDPACDDLECNGFYQGSGIKVTPNTVHTFSYELTNTGTVDYKNYTGDIISAWLEDSVTTGTKVLLYPSSVPDSTIESEIADLQKGNTISSPSAIAGIDGSSCSDLFYGTPVATTACSTGILDGTQNLQYTTNQTRTYNYKFVVFVPNNNIYYDTTVSFGLKSSAQSLTGMNWKQQVHPYISSDQYYTEAFRFTVDTRMTDTIDTDSSHYSGTATAFRIPISSSVDSNGFNWDIYCDTLNAPMSYSNHIGTKSDDGILCSFETPGEYQISIVANEEAFETGWLNSFGFRSDNNGMANDQANKNLFKSIDSKFSRSSKTIGEWGWYLFAHIFNGAKNAVGIPGNLFEDIDFNIINKRMNGIFVGTFRDYAYNSTSATIPSGLFDFLATAKNVGEFPVAFESTFNGCAYNSSSGTIPNDLFAAVDTSSAGNISQMFNETFSSYARKSESGVIPGDLFAGISTDSANTINGLFSQTFAGYAENSAIGTIPAGLFDEIHTSGLTNLSGMFYRTFAEYARESPNANIPQGLFSGIDTGDATNMDGMFNATFSNYATNSTVGTIPSDIFDAVNTGSTTNARHLFNRTFAWYAESSTVGTIPAGVFDGVDLTSVSGDYFLESMFGQTFFDYAKQNAADGADDSNLDDIWGSANFANKITSGNANNVLYITFESHHALTGTAQAFIDTYLGGIIPDSVAGTFRNTNVSDYWSINGNWR